MAEALCIAAVVVDFDRIHPAVALLVVGDADFVELVLEQNTGDFRRGDALELLGAFALRLALGEFADLALDSTRAIPEKALAAGYIFRQPDLAWALRHESEAGGSPGLTQTHK